jgi:CYTH domain-containing protein
MPIEFEYKYVLSKDLLNQVEPWQQPHKIITIQQGYLAISGNMNLRVRHELSDKERNRWVTTLKQKVGDRVVEIEREIEPEDGELLYEVSAPKLTKTRHMIPGHCGQWSEVDVFYSGEEIYFLLLEVEMSEGMLRPILPDCLKKYVIHEVGLTDNRFSNTKLGDVEHTKRLYRELLLEYQHG